MKKLILILFISVLCVNIYAQERRVYDDEVVETALNVKEQQNFKYLIKFKPLATIVGLAYNMFCFEAAFVPYVHPKIGIPIEIQIARFGDLGGVALMSGIEAVPFTHREKSGFYLNYEVGGLYVAGITGFCTAGHVGYQLVTRKGFVLTSAIGLKYDTVSEEISPHVMLDIGFALRK